MTQPTSLGHFVPKSRVWGDSPTSIFDGPRPVKNGKCGHTCIACHLCISCKLHVLRCGANFIPSGQNVPKSGRYFSQCRPLFMPGGIPATRPVSKNFPLSQSENHPEMSRLVRGGFSKKYAAAVSICSAFLVVYKEATPEPEIARAHFLNNLHQVTPLFCPLFWWYMRGQLRSRKWPERISYIVSVKFGTFCPKAGAGQRATL